MENDNTLDTFTKDMTAENLDSFEELQSPIVNEKSPDAITKDMTDAEKLDSFDKELQEIYNKCVAQGFTQDQIELFAHPILSRVDRANRKRLFVRLARIALVVATLTLMLQFEPFYKQVCIHSKIASIKILPYWNWAAFFHYQCIIDNPLYDPTEKLTVEDCKNMCQNRTTVERANKVRIEKHRTIDIETMIKEEQPLIITDAMSDWAAMKNFSLRNLTRMYLNESLLKGATMCGFGSSVDVKWPKPVFVMARAVKKQVTSWYLFWENCQIDVVKHFRKFARRPYFLPPMIEALDNTWIIMGANYTEKFVYFGIGDAMVVWIAQVKGTMKFQLTPNEPCSPICTKLNGTISRGEILMYPTGVWEFSFQPQGNDSIAMAAGGYYDTN